MTARWATLLEVTQAIQFALANALKGNLDLNIYNYPTIRIMRAENGDGNAACYLPVHTCAVLESLGWADGLDAHNKALAAMAASEQIEREAWNVGYREIFFISSDRRTDEFAERLGYERVTAMRKRL